MQNSTRFFWGLFAVLAVIGLFVGCSENGTESETVEKPTPAEVDPSTSAASTSDFEPEEPEVELPSIEDLRNRIDRLWSAKTSEDWSTVFEFQPSYYRGEDMRDRYIEWATENEPFKFHDFEVVEVLADGAMGWTHLRIRSSMRKMPNLPPREYDRWQKWYVVADEWAPVPPEANDQFPEPPPVRNLEEEVKLRERFEHVWNLRVAKDWEALYEILDPKEQAVVSKEQFVAGSQIHNYLSKDVQWVQVIEKMGLIRFTMEYKINDPSLTKYPTKHLPVTEKWVLVDGEWRIRLESKGAEEEGNQQ